MKKILTSTLALCMMIGIVFANGKDDFQFGIRMGMQFSNLIEKPSGLDEMSDYKKMLVGPAFGFVFEIPVLEYFEIRPELNFGSQGVRYKDEDLVYSYWMGYVQVPIFLRGQYGTEKVRGFLQVGPQFGYGTFIMDRLRGKNIKTEKESYTFKESYMKPFDAGLSIGAGVEFPSAKGVELEARYYAGMKNISDSGLKGHSIKNQSVHFTLTLKF